MIARVPVIKWSFISSPSPTARAIVCMRKWEDSLRESVPSFHHIALGDWTQVTRHGTKCLYLLNHLTHLFLFVFKVNKVSYSGSTLSNVNLIPPSCSLQRWQRQVDLLRAFIVWDCGAGVVLEWQIRTGLKEITRKGCTHIHAECGH